MRLCAIVPVYNHGEAIGAVVKALRAHLLPCILVDDGSEPGCAAVLAALAAAEPTHVSVVRLAVNQGKGGAMAAGFRAAHAQGYTHGLQIDADGQHETADVPLFARLAASHPDAIICGCPVFDDSVPRVRFYGRYLTHILVWLNTLSFSIRDSMCGFRVYPLAPTVALMDRVYIGRRMDFDSEIIVRLYWQGLDVINQPTRVRYPTDGISHFRMLRDNVLIARMHLRLFIGMLLRAPWLVARNLKRWLAQHPA